MLEALSDGQELNLSTSVSPYNFFSFWENRLSFLGTFYSCGIFKHSVMFNKIFVYGGKDVFYSIIIIIIPCARDNALHAKRLY